MTFIVMLLMKTVMGMIPKCLYRSRRVFWRSDIPVVISVTIIIIIITAIVVTFIVFLMTTMVAMIPQRRYRSIVTYSGPRCFCWRLHIPATCQCI